MLLSKRGRCRKDFGKKPCQFYLDFRANKGIRIKKIYFFSCKHEQPLTAVRTWRTPGLLQRCRWNWICFLGFCPAILPVQKGEHLHHEPPRARFSIHTFSHKQAPDKTLTCLNNVNVVIIDAGCVDYLRTRFATLILSNRFALLASL